MAGASDAAAERKATFAFSFSAMSLRTHGCCSRRNGWNSCGHGCRRTRCSKVVREKSGLRMPRQIAYNPKAGDDIRLMSPDSVFPGLHDYAALLANLRQCHRAECAGLSPSGSKESLEVARRALLAASQLVNVDSSLVRRPRSPHLLSWPEYSLQQSAFGYDLIADQLSASEKAQIANGFYRNAIRPAVEEYFLNDRMPIAASNHMAHAIGGAIAACIAVYGDVPDWNTRFAPALAELLGQQ